MLLTGGAGYGEPSSYKSRNLPVPEHSVVLRFYTFFSSSLFSVEHLGSFSVSGRNGHCFPSYLFSSSELCHREASTIAHCLFLNSQLSMSFLLKSVFGSYFSATPDSKGNSKLHTVSVFPSSFSWAHWRIVPDTHGGCMRGHLPELKWHFVQIKALGELLCPQPGISM